MKASWPLDDPDAEMPSMKLKQLGKEPLTYLKASHSSTSTSQLTMKKTQKAARILHLKKRRLKARAANIKTQMQ